MSGGRIGPMSEPTARDILTELREMRAEYRMSILELRADLAEYRSRATERMDGISRRLDTLIDAVADLRAEYAGHTHG